MRVMTTYPYKVIIYKTNKVVNHINVYKISRIKKIACRSSKFNAYCLLSCRDNVTLTFCLCRLTVASRSRSSTRTMMSIIISHAQVYHHAKFGCHILNTVRKMAIIVHVKYLSTLRRSCELEWRARSSDWKRIIQICSRTIFIAHLMGIVLI